MSGGSGSPLPGSSPRLGLTPLFSARAGVEDVWSSPETGVVVVSGTFDVEALRSRIEYMTRRPVTVVRGGVEETPDNWWTTHSVSSRHAPPVETPYHWRMGPSRYATPPPYAGMGHLAPPPPPQYAPYPQPAYPYDDGGWLGNHWVLM